nr:hypothetical protein [uncultured Pedobacter sp.]
MSHRSYLYNINTPSIAESADKMMMEWGYEMPLMLANITHNNQIITKAKQFPD